MTIRVAATPPEMMVITIDQRDYYVTVT